MRPTLFLTGTLLLLASCRGSPTPTSLTALPGEPSQASLFQAVATWIVGQDEFPLPRVVYLNREVTLEADVGGPLFGTVLTAESVTTVTDVLKAAHDVRVVPNLQVVEDRTANDILGCYLLLDGGAALTFDAPRSAGTATGGIAFAVTVALFANCETQLWTLLVTWTGSGYGVTDVLYSRRTAV